jgi:F-type H+-transporting ATPase subunit b
MELITPGLGLVVWMTLVFLVLLLILGKFGWPVVSKMIDERETLIQTTKPSPGVISSIRNYIKN